MDILPDPPTNAVCKLSQKQINPWKNNIFGGAQKQSRAYQPSNLEAIGL